MRKRILGFLIVPVAILAGVAACDDDDDSATNAGKDAGGDSAAIDSGTPDATQGTDAGPKDAAAEAAPVVVNQLAAFKPGAFELPEGVSALPNDAGFGTPIVSWTPRGVVAEVFPDGGYGYYGMTAGWTQNASKSLGLTTDPATGDVYLGVGFIGATPAPAVGIYKVPAGGGAPTIASTSLPAGFGWPAGLQFIGADLFIADANGFIFKMNTETGAVTLWKADDLFKGLQTACPGAPLPSPRPFGSNWLAHDTNNVYVSNFDYGALIKIPINGDGTAGAPVVLIQGLLNGGTDCSYQSMKGVVLDKDGSFIFTTSLKNTIWRASADGKTISVFTKGKPPFDQPSGLYIDTDTTTQKRRLLVSNFAINAVQTDAGPLPSLLSIDLP